MEPISNKIFIPDASNCSSDGGSGKLFPDDIAEYGYTSTAAPDSLPYIIKTDDAPKIFADNTSNNHALADVSDNLSFGDKLRSFFTNKYGDRSGLNPNFEIPYTATKVFIT